MLSCFRVIALLSALVAGVQNAHALPRPNLEDCRGASHDSNIWWSGVQHDSFDEFYRAPFGALPAGSGKVTIRLRTCAHDVQSVRLTYWDSRASKRHFVPMQLDEQMHRPFSGTVQYWKASLPVSDEPNIFYYFFELRDGTDTDFYIDDDLKAFPGGLGVAVNDWDDSKSYQISIYDPNFEVPEWTKGAIMYQIFPDRFRNGSVENDPAHGEAWIYGQRTILNPWNRRLCDPLSNECRDQKYNQFYGGDLKGIEQKLDYLKSLGVTGLYLNPIFESPTNHKYDTTNFKKIDPAFGTEADFRSLVRTARTKGMRVVLDGVFNHVSADSPYFDLWGRWDRNFNLISPDGPGPNDASGACESPNSEWRSWFFIPDRGNPAVARDRYTKVYCPNPELWGSQGPFDTYEAWFGFFNVPKIDTRLQSVRDFFYAGGDGAVSRFWNQRGGSGWRLDVAADVDGGWSRDHNNFFWEEFRTAVKADSPDVWIVGEEWGNASPWLLGPEWDSVMNYRLRSALMNWMFDSCYGPGCKGRFFTENDSNDSTSIGPIFPVTEAQFIAQLNGIQESYPPQVWHSLMNLLGSHDTNRILFLLKKISGEDENVARQKLKFLASFIMTYPGAPTIYYGDEAGVKVPGVWDGNTWQDDPYNRAVYPWSDQGLNPDVELRRTFQRLGQLRRQHEALSDGSFKWVPVSGDNRAVAFERQSGEERLLVVFNRHHLEQDIEIKSLSALSGLRKFEEIFPVTGREYEIRNSRIEIKQLEGFGMRVLKLNSRR